MNTVQPDSKLTADAGEVATANEVRRLIRFSAALLFVVFGVFGIWAAIVELYGAVVAPGTLKMEANLKLVQHTEGGVVRRIFVKEGQHIVQGEPIIELEDVEASSTMASVRDQLDAEVAKLARLQAEIRNSSRIDFPAELVERRNDARVKFLLGNEEALFRARNAMLREQSEKLGEQRKAILTEIASLTNQIQAADKSLGYLLDQEKMNELLHAQNFVASARLLDAKRSTAEKEEKKFEFESLQAQARQKLADIELRLASLSSNRLNEDSRDAIESQSKVLNLRERLKPAQDILERRIIRSPATGNINVLHAHTLGGVVAPRETVAEIVPDQSQLVAEIRVNPADIDDVHEGQEVEVELSGLNRRVTPLLDGKVNFVSPDLNSEQGNPSVKFFVARVGLTGDAQKKVTISSGMPVAAYIKTRKRSPLELWLDPIIGAIRKSWRES